MTQDDIIKLATEAGFDFSPMPNMLFTVRGNHAQLVNFAALATQAERDACAIAAVIHSQYPITTDYDEGYDAGRRNAAAAIRARNQAPDCTDCDCADNDPCKRTAPGLALESGEFVPAESITDWSAA